MSRARPSMQSTIPRLIDVGIAVLCVALVALLWSGGYRIELGPFTLKSHSLLNILGGLWALIMARVAVTGGYQNFLLVCAAVLTGLVCGEIALRALDSPMAKPNLAQIHRASDLYDWELIPGAAGVGKEGERITINSAGFRDDEWIATKPPGTKRVAVLGDSFTFGMAVAVEDSYVEQLQRMLDGGDVKVEVLNFGVIGYGMWQYQVLLEREVLKYDPDLIIVGLFLDDILATTPPYEHDPGWTGKNPFEDALPDEFNGSYLWNLIRNVDRVFQMKYRYRKKGNEYLKGIEERKRLIGPGAEYYKVQVGALDDPTYDSFRRVLAQFLSTAGAHKIPVIAAYIPDASQLHEPERQQVNRFLENVARDLDVPWVDVTARFERVPDPRSLFLFPLDAHTSPEGHRHIADALAEEIRKRRLLAL